MKMFPQVEIFHDLVTTSGKLLDSRITRQDLKILDKTRCGQLLEEACEIIAFKF